MHVFGFNFDIDVPSILPIIIAFLVGTVVGAAITVTTVYVRAARRRKTRKKARINNQHPRRPDAPRPVRPPRQPVTRHGNWPTAPAQAVEPSEAPDERPRVSSTRVHLARVELRETIRALFENRSGDRRANLTQAFALYRSSPAEVTGSLWLPIEAYAHELAQLIEQSLPNRWTDENTLRGSHARRDIRQFFRTQYQIEIYDDRRDTAVPTTRTVLRTDMQVYHTLGIGYSPKMRQLCDDYYTVQRREQSRRQPSVRHRHDAAAPRPQRTPAFEAPVRRPRTAAVQPTQRRRVLVPSS